MTPFQKLSYNEQPLTLPLGHDVSLVKLQDDGHVVARAMMIVSAEMTGTTVDGWIDATDEHREKCMRTAKAVLALAEEMKGQRVYKVTMPKPDDDAATLRAMFGGELNPELGPQLREFDEETGVFDVLNEHYRKQRT
ncbi:MAG: hypothetical protein JWQ83_1146 [Lacunisphaera sp.]|nr:hypothetical protein [Lacunisphaera sp.]